MNYARLMLTHPAQSNGGLVPLVVSLAQFGAIVVAQTLGGLLPIAANALKLDPAIMAAPIITSVADALSLILYFAIAASMLI
jgi:magnesium transporter